MYFQDEKWRLLRKEGPDYPSFGSSVHMKGTKQHTSSTATQTCSGANEENFHKLIGGANKVNDEPPDPERTRQKQVSSSSTQAAMDSGTNRSARQWIKLGNYNGKTAVEAFIRKFEVCSRNNGWTDEEKLNQLMCSLVEPANQLLWEFDSATVVTWTDLIQRLRSRYGGSDQMALYQTQLSVRRQRDGEEIGTLVPDIRRLMILAYPGPNTIHSETIAIRSFIDALRDKDIAMKVREREPESLDKAYNLAMRFEGYQKADRNERDY